MKGSALLALGAVVGAAIAGAGLVERRGGPPPAGAVATVNGRAIPRDEYQRALAGAAEERAGGADAALRRRILDRLIDEELLVQRGVALGLPERDPRLRAELAARVIESAVARPEAGDDDEAALRTLWAGDAAYFRRPGMVTVASSCGGAVDVPARRLGELVGVELAAAALALPAGVAVLPAREPRGVCALRVVVRRGGELPSYADARPAVAAEARRRAGERRLRELLDGERARAEIRLAAEAP